MPDFTELLYMMSQRLSGFRESRLNGRQEVLVVAVGNRCFLQINDDWVSQVFTFFVLIRCVRVGDGWDVANGDPPCKRLDIRVCCFVFRRWVINRGSRKSVGDGMFTALSPNCYEDIWRQPFFEALQIRIFYGIQRVLVQDRH